MAPNTERHRWTVQDTASDAFPLGSEVELETLDLLRHLPGRRSVWHAQHAGGDVLLKAYETHAKQTRDVQREWDLANQLASVGLDVAAPLFRATTADGRIAVAFSYIPDGKTLNHALSGESLSALFQLVASQHEAGFYQTDNHLGNYFWSKQGLTMLDAGSCLSEPAPLSHEKRIRNLATLIATIPLGLRDQVDAAFATYSEDASVQTQVQQATVDAVKNRLRRYLKKTRRTCTEFICEEKDNRHWLACRDLDPELAEKLRTLPNQFFEATPLLKDGNTCTVVEVAHGDRAYVLKRYNRKPLGYRLTHALSTPRALISWSHGHALRSFGIPTPRPLVCLQIKHGPLLEQAFLLMEKVEGDALHEASAPESMATESAKRWEELEYLQATHGDMKASNFIISRDGVLTLIDLDSLRFHTSASTFQRQRRKDRGRFLKNWRSSPERLTTFRNALA